jgi:hypothetical protein
VSRLRNADWRIYTSSLAPNVSPSLGRKRSLCEHLAAGAVLRDDRPKCGYERTFRLGWPRAENLLLVRGCGRLRLHAVDATAG